MKRLTRMLLCGLGALMVAACGGGGGEREFGSGGGGPPAATPAAIELTRSVPTISSDRRQSVRLFATVRNAGNAVLANQVVVFTTPDAGARVTTVRGTTDTSGQAEALLEITDSANRVVTVTATTGALSDSAAVQVVGTTVGVSGPNSIVVGAPVAYQVVVRDASGEPVAGAPVTASAANGSTVSVATPVTGPLGTADVLLTAPVTLAGAETLTVNAAGATGVQSIQVSTTLVSFLAPAVATEVAVNAAPTAVRVRVLEAGVPAGGQTVRFTTTRGTLAGGVTSLPVLTDGSGEAATTITSAEAGRALISVTSVDGTEATRQVQFVGSVSARVELHAAPATVGVNLAGGASESSQIIAVVRDLANNPVKGARVDFSATDPSAGAGLSSAFALTDDTGLASVTFYPGALPTGTNAIRITGTVDCSRAGSCEAPSASTKFTDETLLTAARRALQIRIGTGNEVFKVPSEPAPVFNEMPYGVLVTDSAGNAVSGVALSATVVSTAYAKGRWTRGVCITQPCWQWSTDAVCPSEDVNGNLMLDPGEDRNGDGVLAPGNVALAHFGATGDATTGLSDSSGSAVMRIRYLRDRSATAVVRVRISASMPDGTEGAETVEFTLPVLVSDVLGDASPPGAVTDPLSGLLGGIYGTGTDCTARFPGTP